MKFSLTAFLAAVGLTEAKKVLNKQKLLRAAVPVDKNGNRRLEQQAFEITGEYSIQFNHCVSLKIAADQYQDVLFDENVIEATKEGKVLAQTSYILFNVCKTESCYYEDDESLYMVDLATYMGASIEAAQQVEESICQACQESFETCYNQNNYNGYNAAQQYNGEQEAQQDNGEQEANQEEGDQQQEGEQQEGEQEGNQEEGNGGERRLEEVVYYNNVGYKVVDCDTCEAKGCFDEEQQMYDENNANWQITDEVIDEWIMQMLECVDTEVVGPTGNDNLYAGFMCNADGTGVEPAVFLDNACATYTSMYSYGNLVSGTNNYKIMYEAKEHVTTPFLTNTNCENIQYLSIEGAQQMEYEAAQQAQDYNANQQQEEQVMEAAQGCQQLFQNSIDLDTCGGYEENYDQDEDEDVYNEEDVDYSWYTYLVAEDAANDVMGACVVVEALQGEYGSAHTFTESDGQGGGSGHVYDYNSNLGKDMSAGKVFGIIIAVLVVIVAAVLIVQSMGGSKKDTKKVPLVNNKNGAMA